ncbi:MULTISPECIES: hypothetical protein [unclassified Sinorhizobium]|uniref:hypothetical protein n=1 Tax=unclassified Sinorhizobium TaxID=2613772 RepID=UPI0024C328FC|nr:MULTISPECIES: hypothetical protein [unclassified Sinorhizobium]MDK1378430.1 hypothetical protein [Sinorhizobium sp. 6-70]MDK1482133.1 hypothetical protein [Sinorhizobium sp. 6-117]
MHLSRAFPWIGDALTVVVSVAVAVVGSELALRAFPSLQIPVGESDYVFCGTPRTRHQPHARYGFTEIPGNRYFERFSSFDPWNPVKINTDGFRDNATGNGEPVIVLGDSIVRGSLVRESETFSALLNAWHPQLLFKNYGTGGYGQPNEIRLYEDKGRTISHKLLVVGFSLSTDIEDNAERAVLTPSTVDIQVEPAGSSPKPAGLLLEAHLLLWKNSKLYNWIYSTLLRPYVGNIDSRRDIEVALELTKRLFGQVAATARSNGADLLVVILPGWAEMAGRDDGLQPDRQREMIEKLAATTPGMFVVDPTARLAAADPTKTFGVVDKHLSPLGHFLVAEAIDEWLLSEWRGKNTIRRSQHSFSPGPPVEPDCGQLSAAR